MGTVNSIETRLLVRDVIRLVFFVPYDNFDIAPAVSHALDSYLRAVEGQPALSRYVCCYWEEYNLGDRGWELIRGCLTPTRRRFADDYTDDEAFYPLKDGADPYFHIHGEKDSGYCFSYDARIPWREPLPHSVSVLSATLPTELLETRGGGFVRDLALDMASRLPFASGHAGLALSTWHSVIDDLGRLGPLITRHPGFDIRGASIRDDLGTWVDGVHWLNFLGSPVLHALGGASALRSRLASPSTTVHELGGERAVVSLGPEPEAGDLTRGQTLPAYQEFARLLEPCFEPFPWRRYPFKDPSVEETLRRWHQRFLDAAGTNPASNP